ncbi:MUC5B-like protein [Mya arenaria]|uniref:MUC5B-like protein n=1 Tax=Mya arenaria TaxID=6604 RepID=A0ABY7EIL2_MYAAR|nr:MUC5B-like protein [Mya arenaria]
MSMIEYVFEAVVTIKFLHFFHRTINFSTCVDARWACAAKTIPIPTTNICKPNQEFSSCISSCPMTCENMHDSISCNTTTCVEGCICKPGYVKEGNDCVLKADCPCYHGSKAYKEGENTCRSRMWVCEQKDCPAVCSAYGDSHYTTFDGRSFEFQGSCDYVFAKSSETSPVKFEITTENIPCGTTGVTCTKSISFSIGEQGTFHYKVKYLSSEFIYDPILQTVGTANFFRIQLVKGKQVIADADSPFTLREVGNFIIITTPQGITLEWDKGTRLYLKLSTQHKGQVVGLCGNFNGNQKDDFSTPQGGPSASKATSFADSWKEIEDTCAANTERGPWAQKQCSVLSSKLFEACHPVVAYQEFIDRCVFDACACDTGGDCDCLCTAVAAYAHQCSMSGVTIKWRTVEFCRKSLT